MCASPPPRQLGESSFLRCCLTMLGKPQLDYQTDTQVSGFNTEPRLCFMEGSGAAIPNWEGGGSVGICFIMLMQH